MGIDNGVVDVLCEECGKRLMRRLPDGTFQFVFGRTSKTGEGDVESKPSSLISMFIVGSIKIKCYRKTNGRVCGHVNIVNFFDKNVPGCF